MNPKQQSLRSTLLYAAFATAVWLVVIVWMEDQPIDIGLLGTGVGFFAIIFFTMRLTNRLSAIMAGRLAKRVDARREQERATTRREPAAPSERPEHALRRRTAPRQRGRRRR